MNDRISIDSQIHFGKPCVAGTRVTVENVMELVEHGIPFGEICRDYYPELSVDDVKACILNSEIKVRANRSIDQTPKTAVDSKLEESILRDRKSRI